ncbi:hypothetical protein NEAUS03_2251 [Nematocida ausubeli]|nr:hypothetical protein NEAUS03_2251 [Nematocida ausubeli]
MNPKIIMVAATAIAVLFVVGLWNLLRNPTIKQEKKAGTSPNECKTNRQTNVKKDAVQVRKSSIESDLTNNEENSQANIEVYGVLQTNVSLVKGETEYLQEKMNSVIEAHEDDNCGSEPELLQSNKIDEFGNSIPETQDGIEAKEIESNFEDIVAINISTPLNINSIKENPILNTYTMKSLSNVEDATNSQNGDEEAEDEEYGEESSEEEEHVEQEEKINEEENPSAIKDQATSETHSRCVKRSIMNVPRRKKRRRVVVYSADGSIISDGYKYLDVPIPRKDRAYFIKQPVTSTSAPKTVASTSVPKAVASTSVPKALSSSGVPIAAASASMPKAVASTRAPVTTPTTNSNNQPECLSPPPAYTGQPDFNEHPQSTWNLQMPSNSHNLNSVILNLEGAPFGITTNLTCDFENILHPNQEECNPTPKTNQLGEDFYTDASKISQRYKNELKPLNDTSETNITSVNPANSQSGEDFYTDASKVSQRYKNRFTPPSTASVTNITPENPATPKGKSVTFNLENANLNINVPVPAPRKNIPIPSAPEESLLEKVLYPVIENNLYPVIENNEEDADLVKVDPYDYTPAENAQESSAEAGFSDNNSDGVTSTKDKSKKKKTKGLMKGAIKSILGKRKNKNGEEADEAAINGSEETGNPDQSTSQSSMK